MDRNPASECKYDVFVLAFLGSIGLPDYRPDSSLRRFFRVCMHDFTADRSCSKSFPGVGE